MIEPPTIATVSLPTLPEAGGSVYYRDCGGQFPEAKAIAREISRTRPGVVRKYLEYPDDEGEVRPGPTRNTSPSGAATPRSWPDCTRTVREDMLK
jgi:hypothetical protein